ncbi:SUMF1/EgtB/PvdO family nonheme iron enzyme [Lusitaniella coriacea]|uniref:bifunctional serine/threonine-protein kinase/formylglycine-generating enzyme family protein n=1 Tax=Lusitaniella coriacea TaxID=1983105 RepID=UPI003CEA25C9
MSYCFNPACTQPRNPPNNNFCQTCGTKLLLGNRYRPLKLIGQGGFGRTYLVEDEQKPSRPRCVIKQFYPAGQNDSQKAAELFELEAIRLEQVGTHPQIPTLYDRVKQDNCQYIVQEFIDGKNLAQELKEQGVFKEAQIRDVLKDLLPVLQFLHQGEVIHRDIKPENIIRRRQDKRLVLVDFGAAKYATATALAKTGTTIGSAEYVAPEQLKGKATFASDIYSLGATCLHLLVQMSPFDLFDLYEGKWAWRQYLMNNPISPELGKILDKMVQNSLRDRWGTAEEVMVALQASIPMQRKSRAIFSPTTFQTQTSPLQSFEFESVMVQLQQKLFRKNVELQRFPGKAEYFKEDFDNGVSLEMVCIPGGIFWMGSSEWEGNKEESPQHRVRLKPFFLSKYPITQAQWEMVMGNNPSRFKGKNRPVEQVSWYEAEQFCGRLSGQTGKPYRLPSEAEWEYACRGGTATPFHFGETITTDLANYNGRDINVRASKGIYREQTTDVGEFFPNAFGLYDMHGNVREWCADCWHEDYKGAPGDGTPWLAHNRRSPRLLRGGAWLANPDDCRCASRLKYDPDVDDSSIGFRVALSGRRID